MVLLRCSVAYRVVFVSGVQLPIGVLKGISCLVIPRLPVSHSTGQEVAIVFLEERG